MARSQRKYGHIFWICLGLIGIGKAAYPQSALRCYSTLTRPYNKLICPESENAFCKKTISTLSQQQCGKSVYHGERWDSDNGECVWRKCAAECVEGVETFLYKGEEYSRETWCCNSNNYCNGANSLISWTPLLSLILPGILGLYLIFA